MTSNTSPVPDRWTVAFSTSADMMTTRRLVLTLARLSQVPAGDLIGLAVRQYVADRYGDHFAAALLREVDQS